MKNKERKMNENPIREKFKKREVKGKKERKKERNIKK